MNASTRLDMGMAQKKDFSGDDRKQLAKEGKALPDGSYPITNRHDLKSAIHLVGQGHDPENKIKAHIIARARDLGLISELPQDWDVQKCDQNDFKEMAKRNKKRRQTLLMQASPMDVASISSQISAANS